MLILESVTRDFKAGRWGKPRRVLEGVSLSIGPGEVYGLVGASGSGKTTLARIVVGLLRPSAGTVLWEGREVTGLSGRALRDYRRQVQLVFQNPQMSLDPRQTVGSALAEPLAAHGLAPSRRAALDRVHAMLDECGLTRDILGRRPHQISGGQAQRVVLARALALEPRLVIGDEPTSMLDVSVQAQVLEILSRRRARSGLSLWLISHDVDLVRSFCGRAGILECGRIVAEGEPAALFATEGDGADLWREEAL
jgi:ABC-type glutathione transport system ATPase component